MKIINREQELFSEDLRFYSKEIDKTVKKSSFLVLGGAGSIGSAVVKEIFKKNPKKLHVVDISENNLAELVRDIRSSLGYIDGEFKTFALDIGSWEYDAFFKNSDGYDFILNFSALKHVRSEKDPFTLMRMIEVNILNTEKTLIQSINKGVCKYFCVSTDKATEPVNLMGASKRVMELFLMRRSLDIDVSTARFANVAFSEGSLLYSFVKRFEKKQPIVAPKDIKRYFITFKESAWLCILSLLLGENRDIFFPKLDKNKHLESLSDIAIRFLKLKGYEPYLCKDEEEAREMAKILPKQGKWPVLFTESNTTGEKEFEEFFSKKDIIVNDKFKDIGIIKNRLMFDQKKLDFFVEKILDMKKKLYWNKREIVELFEYMLPEFKHIEKQKYLDDKM